MYLRLFSIVLALLAAHFIEADSAQAQDADTLSGALPEIQIEAVRSSETEATAPFAVAVMTRGLEEIALEPGLSLDDVLNPLPGLWVNDRGHFALGERIVIRGMGWRSQFGVRGVQVLLDGIPLTMPDGQAIADIVDPTFIRRAELVRGPASLFWGNAAGGVLFLSTDPQAATPFARGRALVGSYGLRQFAAEAAIAPGRHRLHGFISNVEQDGFRAYSEGRFVRGGLHGSLDLGARTRLGFIAAGADQRAENPGSLTAEQVAADRRMANAANVETRAGKESVQLQTGATLLHDLGVGLLTATAYGLIRDLQLPLSYAYIDVYRRAGGARLALQHTAGPIEWGVGVDGAVQEDDRLNLENVAGEPGGDVSLDQRETVTSLAAFGYGTLHLGRRAGVTAGLRADRVRFELADRLLDAGQFNQGDESGSRLFSAWSPSVGVSYRLPRALLFANYSTAFETPTTTELVNRPDTTGGFNPDLEPQWTQGVEAGIRGNWPEARVRLDAAVYVLSVTNGLIPFQTSLGGDEQRTYFRNTGETLNRGFELALTWLPVPELEAQVTYTGNRFTFEDAALEGNDVPGVPDHRLYASLKTNLNEWWGQVAAEGVSSYFVDDENTVENGGYVTFDLFAGHTGIRLGAVRALPFFKVSNVFDRAYNNSVIINAFGGRYYEPAPGRAVQAGVNVIL